ncbi:MAG: recombination-associated protein RdgC [Pseudomonadales bacterium]
MWFKNLQIYRFSKPFEFSPEQLAEKLAEHEFVPCGSQDELRYGWVAPLGRHGSDMVHAANGYIMICARRQQKILPAGVINEAVEEQILEIEDQEGRKVGRKERQNLKDEMIITLRPRALVRSTLHYAYISPQEGLMVVDAASAKRAEELLDALRQAVGSLPVLPLQCKHIPQQVLTGWLLAGQAHSGFDLGHECELCDPLDEGSVIRAKNQDLSAELINNHLKAGMLVTKLAVSTDAGLECVLDNNLAVKRVSFDDTIMERAGSEDAQDAAEQFDVDFSIMTLELSRFIKALVQAMGGSELADSAETIGHD